MPEAPPAPAPFRPGRLILALLAVALAAAVVVAWSARRTLARDALTGWLRDRGVPSRVEVREAGPGRFRARLSLGRDPANPDFAADEADIRYHLSPAGVQVDEVLLRAPVLRAAVRGGKATAGSLDPLIREMLSRPAPATQPRIRLERARLLLTTDYGPVDVTADATMTDGRLVSLEAISAPTRLHSAGVDLDLEAVRISARTAAGRLTAQASAGVRTARVRGVQAGDARIAARFASAYPELGKSRGLGPFDMTVEAAAAQAGAGGRALARPMLSVAFAGEAQDWGRDLALSGRATAALQADSLAAPEARTGAVRGQAVAEDVRWSAAGGAGKLTGGVTLNGLAAGGLQMDRLVLAVRGDVAGTGGSLRTRLTASANGHGGWRGLGPVRPADGPQVAALKRAAAGFALSAPAVALTLGTDAPAGVRLVQPVALRPDRGGEARLAAAGDALRLTAAGGGLPDLDLTIRGRTTPQGMTADVGGRARVSFGPAVDARIDGAGRLALANGGLTFTTTRCADLQVARLEFGANDVEQLAARLCAARAPLISARGGDWRFAAAVEDGGAGIPFQQVRLSGAAGVISAAGRRGRVSAQVDVTAARVEDTSPQPRVYPLTGSGHAALADYVWTADFALGQPHGPQLLQARLKHDAGLGVGFLTLDTGELTFAEDGLQPAELSPAARAVGSPATGAARFSGRFDWAAVGAGSEGQLNLRDLAFASPVGRVEGLSGTLRFTSLAPLTAAPGQALDVDTVLAIVPLTHLHASFGLADNALKIEGGEAQVGGGRIHIQSLEAPLSPGGPMRGVLDFDGVQLHDLVEATPFADKVELDARVSGRIAFESRDGKVRIEDGELRAVQPGRLSIDRTALTGVQAAGAAPAVSGARDPNVTFTDFAYQAMENLAFDTLTATVATRKDGRLGVLFHMIGRHDPPQKQRIRLTVMDLVRKRFLGRPLPLPSGTKVDLTLDTSLNLDDLLADYADFRKLHGSGQVQP